MTDHTTTTHDDDPHAACYECEIGGIHTFAAGCRYDRTAAGIDNRITARNLVIGGGVIAHLDLPDRLHALDMAVNVVAPLLDELATVRAAVDAAFRHQLRRIGWASIDDLQAAYVQTDRWYEAADEEVKRQRSEIAELRRIADQRTDALAAAMAERDEARRQSEAADRRFQEVCNRLDEEGNRALTLNLERDEARRQLADIRAHAERWIALGGMGTNPADNGRAILRLLDGDQP